MRTASVADVKARFDAVLRSSEQGPVVVTRNGKPVAMLLGVQDEEELERLLMAHSPQLQAILERSRQQIQAGDVLSHEEMWAEVAAIRAAPRKSTTNGGLAAPRKNPRGRSSKGRVKPQRVR